MKHLILAAALLTTSNVFAHIKKGNYVGVDQSGKSCAFSVGETWFEHEMEHPLTERIELTKLNFAAFKPALNHFQTSHPTIVNIESGEIGYNHDIFQDTMPTFVGAVSVTILKGETADGSPKGIIYIENNYKNKAESKKVVCLL